MSYGQALLIFLSKGSFRLCCPRMTHFRLIDRTKPAARKPNARTPSEYQPDNAASRGVIPVQSLEGMTPGRVHMPGTTR
jgi:hypothetical protein